MAYGLKAWDESGGLTFDSSAEHTLFYVDEQNITGASVNAAGGSRTFDYPALAGKKISALLQCPYGDLGDSASIVLSCRVSYPAGVPRVVVFAEGNSDGYTNADAYLIVMWTGAAQ